MTITGKDDFVTRAAENCIGPAAAKDRVFGVVPNEQVAASTARNPVTMPAALKRVSAGTAKDCVVASVAEDLVAAII